MTGLASLGAWCPPRPLGNDHIARGILRRLRGQRAGSFIRRMSLEFGVAGIDHHNPAPLYKLGCRLVRDSCASARRPFDEFARAARLARAGFGIVRLFSTDRTGSGDNPVSLNAGPDLPMSMYVDMEAEEARHGMLGYLLEEGDGA